MKFVQTLFYPSFLLTTVLTAMATTKGDDKKAVEQAVEKLRKAMLDGDRSLLEAVAAEDLSYGHSNGRVETKKEFVEAFATGVSDFKTIDLTEQTITVVGNTATVRHEIIRRNQRQGCSGYG